MAEIVGVRFKGAGKVYYFDPDEKPFSKGDHVIVETARGIGMESADETARYLAGALTQERLLAAIEALDALNLSILHNANQNLLITRLCSTLRRAVGK